MATVSETDNKPMTETVDSTKYTITLQEKNGTFRWKRDDGQIVSPLFTSIEAAKYYGEHVPFMTDAEWKEYGR